MAKVIYRVVAACNVLGFGFPKESLEAAVTGGVDAIVADAGSKDAGPYYLGTGTEYFGHAAVRRDFELIVRAAQRVGAPVILGSCGMAGGNRNLAWMVDVAKQVFDQHNVRNVKVATIAAELAPGVVINEFRKGALLPLGRGPEVTEAALRESTIVGQMGIHPLISALNAGAKYVFAGRACDSSLFAADMIRHGIDPGLAYHVGQVLECGALACDPGSPSDCLVAEIHDDGSASFVAPNPGRRCTPHSIAANALYEASHPQLRCYPEGVLSTEQTEFHARSSRTAAIRGSQFVRTSRACPGSIKLEGARLLGRRKLSLIFIDKADLPKIPDDVLVYGRNGVQMAPAQHERGIIVEAVSTDPQAATRFASLVARLLNQSSFPGRGASSGNIAYPLSPHVVSFRRADGLHAAMVPGGTRDRVFCEHYASIKQAVIRLVETEFPDALANASYRIIEADADNPAILLRTTDPDPQRLEARHRQVIARMTALAPPKPESRLNLDIPDEYVWSLYHLMRNDGVIRPQMFPITWYQANGAEWTQQGTAQPHYFAIGITNNGGSLDERTQSLIADAPPLGSPQGTRCLADMAAVIRSKDVGVGRLTFDIIFTSPEAYEAALRSNLFHKDSMAELLRLPVNDVVGTYFVDSCNAIKVTIVRPNISASSDERDVFGTQQQMALEQLTIPLYNEPLLSASAL